MLPIDAASRIKHELIIRGMCTPKTASQECRIGLAGACPRMRNSVPMVLALSESAVCIVAGVWFLLLAEEPAACAENVSSDASSAESSRGDFLMGMLAT
jgi:hypothetical protein